MNKIILNVKNLKKNFFHQKGKIEVLKNLNFSVKKGDLIALTGPSGSGKSTLLHLIALMEKPSSGKIFFSNKNVSDLSDNEMNKIRKYNISLIFQNNNLISDLNVIENVMLPLLIREENHKKSHEKAKKILSLVNLSKRWDFFPSDLSGGEQQRVAIARSLIAETDLILADEPTGNLDFKTSREIFNYFLKLKKMKKTILFATHNRELANKADYKLSIFNGNIKRVNGKK
jgi:lipoprotein-releasing system ATP-binding protein|tara:strand:+ start:2622 stop:3311 length:690 start_codon:yes stop_codon:yes gene_type:complete